MPLTTLLRGGPVPADRATVCELAAAGVLPSPLDAHTSRRHAPALALLRRLGVAPVADVDYEGAPSARFTRTVPPA